MATRSSWSRARRSADCWPCWPRRSPASVSVDRLLEALWDGAPPRTGRKSLQAHVVRLRTALEPDRPTGSPGRYVVRRHDGYALALEREQLDATAFADLAARGRALLSAGDAAGGRRAAATGAGPLARPPVRRLAGRTRPRRRAGAAGGDPRPTAWRRSGRRSSPSAATPRRCPSSVGWSASSRCTRAGGRCMRWRCTARGRQADALEAIRAARARAGRGARRRARRPAARAGAGDPGPGPRARPRHADRGRP